MIKSVAFFFLLLLCLNACNEKPGHHALRIADSLANIVPDSAILFLENLKEEMTTAPEATQMYYAKNLN